MATKSSATAVDTSAVYFELNPKLLWLVRIVNIITLLMVAIAIILCFVKAPDNHSYYLLVCNLVKPFALRHVCHPWAPQNKKEAWCQWHGVFSSVVTSHTTTCISKLQFVWEICELSKNWWYKSGDLGSEKYWFVLLIGLVILFQCLSSDIFVFKEEEPSPAHVTTTRPPHNGSTVPIPWTSMIPPSTKQVPV